MHKNVTKVNADLELTTINDSLNSLKIYYKENSIKRFLETFKDAKIQGINIEFIKADSLLEDEEDFFDNDDILLLDDD